MTKEECLNLRAGSLLQKLYSFTNHNGKKDIGVVTKVDRRDIHIYWVLSAIPGRIDIAWLTADSYILDLMTVLRF